MRRKQVKKRRPRPGARPATSEGSESTSGPSDGEGWGAGILGDDDEVGFGTAPPSRPEKKESPPKEEPRAKPVESKKPKRDESDADAKPASRAPRGRSRSSAPSSDRAPRSSSDSRSSRPDSRPSKSDSTRQPRERSRKTEDREPSTREPRTRSAPPRKPSRKPEAPRNTGTDLPDETLRDMYRCMVKIRVVDERMLKLQRQGRISFYGSATGQEAAVVGSAFAVSDEDWIVPALREGGTMLVRDWPLENYVAQCFGTAGDVTKGRQMPSHYADKAVRVVSWSSCIGNQLPHATGMAWAAKILGDKTVILSYMGDGATSEGDFHTALNFAGVAGAPVVFFCQNNQWAISMPWKAQTASETIAIKAEAYGFPGVRVDGNNILEVYNATHAAVNRAREGKGPTLIEALTYRMGAHSTSDDPTKYRDEAEVESWKKKDPIRRFRNVLMDKNLWSRDEEYELIGKVENELITAIKKVETQPRPSLASMFEDVYATQLPHLKEQAQMFMGLPLSGGSEVPRRRRRRRSPAKKEGEQGKADQPSEENRSSQSRAQDSSERTGDRPPARRKRRGGRDRRGSRP